MSEPTQKQPPKLPLEITDPSGATALRPRTEAERLALAQQALDEYRALQKKS